MEQIRVKIKNMVCPRCIMAVKGVCEDLDFQFIEVKLGEIILPYGLTDEDEISLSNELTKLGFELLNDKQLQLIEQIKNEIINIVHHQEPSRKIGNLSEQLQKLIGFSYSGLSKLFSEIEGITIEKYLILQKIEKAKELLFYEELSVGEIAFRLNYSSSQHFSRQFKSITGLTPSAFCKNKKIGRNPINEV